jgi:hypothetical protein
MSVWQDVVSPRRRVEVYSPRPVEEARTSLGAVLEGRRRPVAPFASAGGRIVAGAIDGPSVWFSAVLAGGRELPPIEFEGTLEATGDGSLLAGSLRAPMVLGLPAAGLTAGVGLFLWWGGVPLVLVALGVIAWAFLTIVVLASLQERRLGEASEVVGRFLQVALDTPPIADANERR